MTGIVPLRDNWSHDMYVSEQTMQIGLSDLLTLGREKGFTTSITLETEWSSQPDTLTQRFHRLVEIVHEECAHLSSVREVVLHPAYQQIVGMGPSALPLILRELKNKPGHWFWALRAISQDDPVLPDHQGVIEKMAQDWLNWARKKGFLF